MRISTIATSSIDVWRGREQLSQTIYWFLNSYQPLELIFYLMLLTLTRIHSNSPTSSPFQFSKSTIRKIESRVPNFPAFRLAYDSYKDSLPSRMVDQRSVPISASIRASLHSHSSFEWSHIVSIPKFILTKFLVFKNRRCFEWFLAVLVRLDSCILSSYYSHSFHRPLPSLQFNDCNSPLFSIINHFRIGLKIPRNDGIAQVELIEGLVW